MERLDRTTLGGSVASPLSGVKQIPPKVVSLYLSSPYYNTHTHGDADMQMQMHIHMHVFVHMHAN